MKTYFEPLQEYKEYNEILAKLKQGKTPIKITGCIDSQKCHIIESLAVDYPFRLVVTYSEQKAKEILEDLKLYDKNVMLYPSKDVIFYNADIRGNAIIKERMKIMKRLFCGEPVTAVTSFDGGMDRLLPLSFLKKNILSVKEGENFALPLFQERLLMLGYERQSQVEAQGEFAVRGGIVDVFPLTEDQPYRIEFWGDEVDSIRSFEITTQRSLERIEAILLFPAAEIILDETTKLASLKCLEEEKQTYVKQLREQFKTEEAARIEKTVEEFKENLEYLHSSAGIDSYIRYFYQDTVSFFDYFEREGSIVFLDEPSRLSEKGEAVAFEFSESMIGRLEKGYILPRQMDVIFDYKALFAGLCKNKCICLSMMDYKISSLVAVSSYDITARSVNPYNNNFEILVKDLKEWKRTGYRTILLSASRTRAARLAEDLREHELNAFYSEDQDRVLQKGEIIVAHGSLHRGFEYPLLKFVIISESDIFGAEKKQRKKAKTYEGSKIQNFSDLHVGDYVVHENHGVGIFRGIEQIEVDHICKDYIKLEYGCGGSLYVLATGLEVLQKYAGADAKRPKLNKLNSLEWKNTKTKVRSAVKEIAQELVSLYAIRQSKEGYPFCADTVWQREFEEMFPYQETEDQLRAIEDTKQDMESTKIMDRLICGDVGYGKTEIAIRAAFKAVSDDKQVVVLVPTTILAQQHYNTFSQRMKDFPVSIGVLSRFRTQAEQKKTLERLKKGQLDIVIGTHRILSKDVVFKRLGLLIVDEEQRFGVTHKEKIKKLKENIDVLTLTATPIPRTLHMSLIGIRDMSVLDEPPVDRQPVQTFVLEHNDEMIREAIHRELTRGGQVYYVYNRVQGIEEIASLVARLVPEANVAFAHGQMQERQLEKIMFQFINGEIDVLVSTTIIETGMDISNVNTMIIDDADRLGLSQLYQLRGRVGRSNRTSYAFLMYKRDKMLKEIAEKRLSAIREFTELGSGFKIAMRDLELRGAGNLLGAQQSGHMEAVGYDLYCKMLNDAVRSVKGEKEEIEEFETMVDIDFDAYIPSSYIKNEMQKLEMYKRIAGIETEEELSDMQEELTDRFGDIPLSVNNLLHIALIKAMAHNVYVTSLIQKQTEVKLFLYAKAKLQVEQVPTLLSSYQNQLKLIPGQPPSFLFRLETPPGKKKNSHASTEFLFCQMKELLKNIQKICLQGTLLLVLLCLLTGCSSIQSFFGFDYSKEQTDSILSDAAIFSVNGEEITEQELFLYMQPMKEETEAIYGKDIWDFSLNAESTSYEEDLKENLMQKIQYIKIVSQEAKKANISLDEEELLNVNNSTEDYLKRFTKKQLQTYGIEKEIVQKIYHDHALALKYYEVLTLNVDTKIPDVEVRHMVLQYVMLEKAKIVANGEQVLYSEKELKDIRKKGETFIGKVRKEKTGKTLSECVSGSDAVVEVTVDKKELIIQFSSELAEVAYNLKKGEVSDLLETNSAYFILFCVEETNEDATNAAKLKIIEERQQELFESGYEEWEKKAVIAVNREKWDNIHFQ